ncbi:Kae1-associated serine/threonine protein kinase [Candidatus Pacearchaeota archaeon]|nr:Kae1-associated serine/threonine protein kinase [Candidatus Pacearchaeota archaeon]
MQEQIIQQGAEAILIKKGEELIKRRVKKGYRISELDEKLRKSRTRKEFKLLEKARNLIDVPSVKKVSDKEMEIDMEFIEGEKLSDNLDNLENWRGVCLQIGENIAKLHDAGIIHGDLTTSNMIWKEQGKKVYFIDFGLGFFSDRVEDKAVDLHLIKEALEAKHFKNFENYFKTILQGYKISKNYKEILRRLERVERRGRYKEQY